MKKRNRLRDTRPKALFGSLIAAVGAPIAASLIGSGINAIGNLIGTGIDAFSSSQRARSEAEEIKAFSQQQAKDAEEQRKLQIDLNNQRMNLLKSNFNRINDSIRLNNTNSILKGAVESENRMRRNAAPQVRNGGSITPKRRRLRSSYKQNIPGITFPDNGGAEVLEYAPNSITALLIGQNHSKGGVKIDANGKKGVEAEGGELMKVEYQNGGNINNIKFISKHDLPGSGFNPAEAVLAGMMSPDEAYAAQEYIKDVNGISDDGRAKYGTSSPLRRMRCGGRKKAPYGTYLLSGGLDLNGYGTLRPSSNWINSYNPENNNSSKGSWGWNTLDDVFKGNLAGAGLTFAGNLLGTGINAFSNWRNSRRIANAQQYAADLMSDTYRNLPVIDANFMDNVRHANAIAVTQAPNYIDRYSRTANERSLQRGLRDIDRNSLSSAAASNRRARAEINAGDAVTKIAENEARINQGIIQNNLGIINDTIQKNVASQNQFNTQLAAIRADLLSERYQQLRENQVGASQYRAQGRLDSTQTLAGANQQNWANLGNTIASGLGGFGNVLATNGKMSADLQNVLLGASDDAILRYIYGSNGYNAQMAARGIYNRYINGNAEQRRIAQELNNRFGPF